MVRGASAALATLALALVLAGPAASATRQQMSQRIFADLADNGRLDGHYTRAQIDRALRSPSLKNYEPPASAPSAPKPPSQAVPSASDARGSVPFSGLDLALFGAVGVPLLLLGASLGHLARLKPEGEPG
jgi:hypothetical protein